MNKIAIFGKPGSGKSALAMELTSVIGIQLYQLDSLLYKSNGDRLESKEYDRKHEKILSEDSWIIDGFDRIAPFNKRLAVADTLIYIDLPYFVSYYLVTKRLIKGLFVKPLGWPEGSSIIKGTLQSYRVLKHCPSFWNESFFEKIQNESSGKTIHVIRSISELNKFVDKII